MRSYYSHLQKLDTLAPKPDPVLRSSAIFPVFQNEKISTRLIFLGYWLLKRNIAHIEATVTLRDNKGSLIKTMTYPITLPKAYQVEVKDLISGPFFGSLELEFYSTEDLIFPYPAVTVNYYGKSFSTVVHTSERTYNNALDARKNSETHVPESGFNIYSSENEVPFITMINGAESLSKQNIAISFYNLHEEKLSINLDLEKFNPYETKIIYPAEGVPLTSFLRGKPGTCKMNFNLANVFPRLLVGNQLKNPFAQVITHTYYDCSKADAPSNFWDPQDDAWHPASLMIPLMSGTYTTTLSFYPIFAPSAFALDLEIYNKEGQLLGNFSEILKFTASFDQFVILPLHTLYPSNEPLSLRVIARPLSQVPIPARIKLALDIGVAGRGLPCNICTNLQPYIPAFTEKKTSFKWAPLLADQPHPFAFIMNSSPKKEMNDSADILLTFYREKDTETLKRTFKIPPQGFYLIDVNEDDELKKFLGNTPGWFTAVTTNPYTTTYYFAENPSGVIGGDHGY